MSHAWSDRARVFLLVLQRRGISSSTCLGARILSFDEPVSLLLAHSSGCSLVYRRPEDWQEQGRFHNGDWFDVALRAANNIISIAVDPVNARWIAVGDAEGYVRIAWRSRPGTAASKRAAPRFSAIIACASSPRGDTFVSGGADGVVQLWNASDGALLQSTGVVAALPKAHQQAETM